MIYYIDKCKKIYFVNWGLTINSSHSVNENIKFDFRRKWVYKYMCVLIKLYGNIVHNTKRAYSEISKKVYFKFFFKRIYLIVNLES